MKRIASIILSILQVLLLVGAAVLMCLDKKSMGVMRYLSGKNRVWNGSLWSGWLPILMAVVMAGLLVWAVLMLARKRGKNIKRVFVPLAAISLVAGIFALFTNTTIVRAYWFVCAMLAAAAIIQSLKCKQG